MFVLFYCDGDHRDLHVLTHSFPTRRSSDLPMNFGLSGEQQMIVDTVRSFVEKELYPHEAAVERTDAVPREIGQEIARKCLALGFFAANMPEIGRAHV